MSKTGPVKAEKKPEITSEQVVGCELYEDALFMRMGIADITIEPGDPFNEDSEEPRKLEIAMNLGTGSIIVTDERTRRSVLFGARELVTGAIKVFEDWDTRFVPDNTEEEE